MTTYNIRKLTAEFAKEQQQQVHLSQQQQQQQQPSSPYFHQTTAAAPTVAQYQYQPQQQYQYKQQATTTAAETMCDEPVSYVSSAVLEVLSQEAEQFHFSTSTSTSTATTTTATSTESALFFERPSFVTAAALSPVIPASTCAPLLQWTYSNSTTATLQQTQTPTQGHRQQQSHAHDMTRFMFSPSMAAVQVHTPLPSFVAQLNNNYNYSPQQQQQQYGQASDWGRDPTLSPLSQDVDLGSNSNLADLSDLDSSPVLSGYDAHELGELLKDDGEYNFVFDGSDNSTFHFINSLVGNDLHHQQHHNHHYQHNHVVPAPPPPTPATTIVATPPLAPCSPLPMSAAAASSMHFHVSSPTPTPLSPPCVPYSPSVPFMVPSNLFQYTLPTSCSFSYPSSSSSSSSSGAGSVSTPIVKPFSSSTSSSATQRSTTLKAKSRKRTSKTPVTPASSHVSDTTSSPVTPVVSSIPYFDHNNEKRFRCAWPSCPQEFERHHNCKAHYSTHTGERHFKCPEPDCQSKSFRQKGDLTRHMRIHSNERPYACGGAVMGCEMAYGRCDQKAKHERKCSHFLAMGL